MIEKIDNSIFGMFDDIEFETDENLLQIVDLLKDLSDIEYGFVLQNTMRIRGN